MAKLPRVTQKIFAGSASNNGKFGSLQAGAGVDTNDIALIQSLAAWGAGWNSAVVGSQQVPPLEEMQGIDYVITTQMVYMFQEGIVEYDAATNYFQNSIVKKAGTYQIWGSKIDNNLGNSLVAGANWQFLCDLSNPSSQIVWGGTAGGTANALTITATGATAVAGQVVIFMPASANTGAATIALNGGLTVAVTKGGANTLVPNDLVAAKVTMAVHDGTQWQIIDPPEFAHGADVASAATTVLDGTNGTVLFITGTTNISNVTLKEGRIRICIFSSGGSILAYAGGNVLLNTGGTNYTIAAGDVVIFIGLNSGAVRALIIPANGKSPIAPVTPKLNTTEIIASGNFTTSANITSTTKFSFRLVAGGAGGSGTASSQSGASGGAGETVDWTNVTGLAPSTSYAVTIGAAGSGGSSGANAGSNGGNTSIVIGSDTVTANGGVAASGFNGGLGGTGSHSGPSVGIVTASQGGGGGAGTAGNQTCGGLGMGGSSSQGGGAAAVYQAAGVNAGAYGAGGSGGNSASAAGAFAGGNGKSGLLIATWIE